MTTAARRAISRLHRNWTIRLLLPAGIAASIAGFLYLGHCDTAAAEKQFHLATDERFDAIRREIANRAALTGAIVGLRPREGEAVRSMQAVVNTAPRGAGVETLWVPWNGGGEPERAIASRLRFDCGGGVRAGPAPAWLGDAMRRAAAAAGIITVPADSPGGAELLIFAAPVFGPRGGLTGVAMVTERVGEVVERALSKSDPEGIDLTVEDAALGGRRIWRHRSRLRAAEDTGDSEFVEESTLRFADRVWKVRAASTTAFLHGRNRWTHWGALSAGLLLALPAYPGRRRTGKKALTLRLRDVEPRSF